jgi:hypothetical protein
MYGILKQRASTVAAIIQSLHTKSKFYEIPVIITG